MVLQLTRHNGHEDALCHLLMPQQARSGALRGLLLAGGKVARGSWHQRRMERAQESCGCPTAGGSGSGGTGGALLPSTQRAHHGAELLPDQWFSTFSVFFQT